MKTIYYFCLSFYLLSATWTMANVTKDHAEVILNQAVHFLSPGDDDVVVNPGTYQIEQAEEWLRLISGERTDAILIQAQPITHEERLASVQVLSVSGEEDRHHLLLLFPDGHGMESVGTYSGIRPRGGFSLLSPTKQTFALQNSKSVASSKSAVSPLPAQPRQLQIHWSILLMGLKSWGRRPLKSFLPGNLLPQDPAFRITYFNSKMPTMPRDTRSARFKSPPLGVPSQRRKSFPPGFISGNASAGVSRPALMMATAVHQPPGS
jgi:hypothetical protein